MSLIFIDLETVPAQPEEECKAAIAETISHPSKMSKAETIADWHSGAGKYAGAKDAAIDDKYRKTSFDGGQGEIISIAWASEDNEIKSKSRHLDDSEGDFLKSVLDEINADSHNEVAGTKYPNKPFFVGHYISGFDLKFLFHRCVVLGVKPPFEIPFDGRHGKDYFDTMIAWAGFRDSISQDNLCKALKIEGKPSDISGAQVWDFIKAGKYEEVEAYNRDDVKKVRLIYNRLNFKG